MNLIPKLRLPTHLDLPDKDNSVVENLFELPQAMLLTETLLPTLQKLHPEGRYAVGGNALIYFRYTEEDPLKGCRAPDWFYVPGVPPMAANGHPRRSYVMWQEKVAPTVLLEFASGVGDEERDRTPEEGKFWIYERQIRPLYYGIFAFYEGSLEMYHLRKGRFRRAAPNRRGRYPVPELGVELGLWRGSYVNQGDVLFLRWYDRRGRLLLTGHELAEEEKRRADHLAAKLRELGVDPDAV